MRTACFIVLMCLCIYTPFALSMAGVFLYALRYRAYEAIILGAFVDLAFAHVPFLEFPLYTLTTGALVLFVELAKPSFAFYNSAHGSS